MLLSLTLPVVRALKKELARVFPDAKSAHLSEALARGLGFETNSVLAARVPEEGHSPLHGPYWGDKTLARLAMADDAVFLDYLAAKGVRSAKRPDEQPVPPVYRGPLPIDQKERPLLQAALRVDAAHHLTAESPAELTLKRLAARVPEFNHAWPETDDRAPGALFVEAETHKFRVALLGHPSHPGFDDPLLIRGYRHADLWALTRLGSEIVIRDHFYDHLRSGAMPEWAADPQRLGHLSAEGGLRILLWPTAAVVSEYTAEGTTSTNEYRVSPAQHQEARAAIAAIPGTLDRVRAVRDIVRGGDTGGALRLSALNKLSDKDERAMMEPYREAVKGRVGFEGSAPSSFCLNEYGLLVQVSRLGASVFRNGSPFDLTTGLTPEALRSLIDDLDFSRDSAIRYLLWLVREGVLTDLVRIDGYASLPRPYSGPLMSDGGIEMLLPVRIDGGPLEYRLSRGGVDQYLLAVQHAIDLWIRSGGLVDQANSTNAVAFGNVQHDIRAALGDIHQFAYVLRKHHRLISNVILYFPTMQTGQDGQSADPGDQAQFCFTGDGSTKRFVTMNVSREQAMEMVERAFALRDASGGQSGARRNCRIPMAGQGPFGDLHSLHLTQEQHAEGVAVFPRLLLMQVPA